MQKFYNLGPDLMQWEMKQASIWEMFKKNH